jgi:hypothetical protein
MSQTVKAISQSGVSKTLTLTTDYQDLFTYGIVNGTVDINMVEGGVDVGTLKIIVGGGIAKTDVCTGGLYFDQAIDNTRLPTTYTPSSNGMNYTVKFYYDGVSKIQVAKEINDPELTITFTGIYNSCQDVYSNSTYRVDKLIENVNGAGIDVANTLKLNGGVEMANLPSDTITYNTLHEFITFTNVSSKATRVGKLCNIVVKATLSVSGALLSAGSIHDFFSVTPTASYSSSYVNVGIAMDGVTNASSALFNDANTADFKLVLPRSLSDGSSTTIYASISYVSS